jgi:hypothetical protein
MSQRGALLNLPMEIINYILEFNGDGIKYRNGKYMNQIRETDERYTMLRSITAKTYDLYRYADGTVALCITRIVIPPTTTTYRLRPTTLNIDIRTDPDKPYIEYSSWCSRSLQQYRTYLY